MRAHVAMALVSLFVCGGVAAAQDDDQAQQQSAPPAKNGGDKSSEGREINLIVGQQKSLSAAGVQSYSEGVPGIISVKIPEDQRRIVVSAVRAGATTLMLIHADGKADTYYINVYSKDP